MWEHHRREVWILLLQDSNQPQRKKLFLTFLWKNLYIDLSRIPTLTPLYCHFASAGSLPRSSRPGGWESLAIASPSQPIPDHGRENASRQDLIALPLPPALRQCHPFAAAQVMLPNRCSCLRLTRSSCTRRPARCVSPCHCLAWNRSKTLHH